MRILYLVHTVDWLETGGGPYHGAGWTSALIRSVLEAGHTVGVVYQTSGKKPFRCEQDGVRYYALPASKPSLLGKLGYYYGGYKRDDGRHLLPGIREAVADFRPELIHLFGFENPMAALLDVPAGLPPVAVHVQGLLNPISKAFFPPGLDRGTFRRRFPFREIVLRNGTVHAINNMEVRARRERSRMAKAAWVLGRTAWDREIAREMAPQAVYFPVNEMLRDVFYAHAGRANYAERESLQLISTLSETVYKGFDLVLRTARALRAAGCAFQWTVAGMAEDSALRRFFEKETGIRAAEVGVRCVGNLAAEALCGRLLEGDVYVHPSYMDNSPNSLCEAQLLGLPAVACAVGGVPSLVEAGRTGCLVPAGDPEAMAAALLRMKDVALREKLGRNAASVAAVRHDKKTILRDLENAYNQILTCKASPSF